jgi:hypothetical protein
MDLEWVVPEQRALHQCLCVLPNGRCEERTVPPDAPFCGTCEARHPELKDRSLVQVWQG